MHEVVGQVHLEAERASGFIGRIEVISPLETDHGRVGKIHFLDYRVFRSANSATTVRFYPVVTGTRGNRLAGEQF